MLLRTKKEVKLTITFEQCSYVRILEKACSVASRPKMIVDNHYGYPNKCPQNDQERIFS